LLPSPMIAVSFPGERVQVSGSHSGPGSAPQWPELTESEFTVVSLVARGATSREVAERLYLSPFTVNSHLKHVFTKLGIRSRVELTCLAAERGILGEHR
jgi:DNA-binding CsgD family transcriptional regulator